MKRIPYNSSIFSVETKAVDLALDFIMVNINQLFDTLEKKLF